MVLCDGCNLTANVTIGFAPLGFEAALPGNGQRRDGSVPLYTSLQVSDYDPEGGYKRLSGDGTPYLNQQRHFGKSGTRGYGHISPMGVAFLPSLGQSPAKECKQCNT